MGKLIKGDVRKQIHAQIGAMFAEQMGEDIYRTSEGIIIETAEGDVVIKAVLKKEEVVFTLDDVLDTYEATKEAKARTEDVIDELEDETVEEVEEAEEEPLDIDELEQ